jgi:hypothetical protein
VHACVSVMHACASHVHACVSVMHTRANQTRACVARRACLLAREPHAPSCVLDGQAVEPLNRACLREPTRRIARRS